MSLRNVAKAAIGLVGVALLMTGQFLFAALALAGLGLFLTLEANSEIDAVLRQANSGD